MSEVSQGPEEIESNRVRVRLRWREVISGRGLVVEVVPDGRTDVLVKFDLFIEGSGPHWHCYAPKEVVRSLAGPDLVAEMSEILRSLPDLGLSASEIDRISAGARLIMADRM